MTAATPSSPAFNGQTILERTADGACCLLARPDMLPPEARRLLARLNGYTPLAALARDADEALRFEALAQGLWRDALARSVDVTLH